MYRKKDMNIESYDENDAFYTGSDEEYEEFLKNAEVTINSGEPEPVSNTQKINLNDTINLQNVIDRFKKTAGEIGHGAKKMKENVVSKMDSLKAVKKDEILNSDGLADIEEIKEKAEEKIKAAAKDSADKLSEIKQEIGAMSEVPEKVGNVDAKLGDVSGALDSVSKQLEEALAKMDKLSSQTADSKTAGDDNASEIKETLRRIDETLSDIRQSVGSVSKLNDSVFDLKNTQMNTKNAVSNLETAFSRLKKKCILGVTVLSILSAIVILLEIVLMLS